MTRGANQIDYHCLLALGACRGDVRLFRKVFGDGPISITVRNAQRARAAGVSVRFLECAVSDAAMATYRQMREQAFMDFYMSDKGTERKGATAWGAYLATREAPLVVALNTPETP